MKHYIDLHLHLDGALSVEMAKKLAQIQNIELPTEDDEKLKKLLSVPSDCQSLNEYLECFELPLSLLQTKESIREAVYMVAEELKRESVIYGEIRFAPQLHTQKGLNQRQVVMAALEGLHKTSLKCNLILCCMRGADIKDNMETVEMAREFLVENDGVVALDLAGAEALFPTSDYKELFERAKGYGIPFTIHAGEAAGADSIKEAVEFGAKRIGHGIRAMEDLEVMELLFQKGIFLEMCPTSNFQTKAVETKEEYPIKKFLEKNLKVTINTDNMGISQTTIKQEMQLLRNEFGISSKDEELLMRNAIEAAFADEKTKQEILLLTFSQQ